MKRIIRIFIIAFFTASLLHSNYILIPMDDVQSDHLKAYGLTYHALKIGKKVEWLLNYRGGAFLFPESPELTAKANIMGVRSVKISSSDLNAIFETIESENMERIVLEKAPKVAVYSPSWTAPWDDAVTMVLEYAEIPYDKIWDKEVLKGDLSKYDWLHLHHEDFTGQYNRFWYSYRNAAWYQRQVALFKKLAREAGYDTVREHKAASARMIQKYVYDGGFLFTMCTATETIDIALAYSGVDFIPPQIDGTPYDPLWKEKADYEKTFAFEDFTINVSPYINPFSDIDYNWVNSPNRVPLTDFELFDFSAKIDPVPTMLNQNHKRVIKGFYGLTTAFRRDKIKESVTVLADTPKTDSVKYIHGVFGAGHFTFYGGHDPEDANHYVGDLPTELSLRKNSAGYRLILNNVLFPSAKKEKKKT